MRAGCPVSVWAVCGNHGRAGGHRSSDPTRIIEQLTLQIARAKCGNVDWNQAHDGAVMHWRIGDTGVLLVHGDRTPKTAVDIVQPYRCSQRDVRHWLLITGHMHFAKSVDHLDTTWVQAGSLVGPDTYASHSLGVGARASQCIVEVRRDGPRPAYVMPLK